MTNEFTALLTTTNEDLKWQLLVPQDQAVNLLLDLYNLAPTESVKAMIGTVIEGVRHKSLVRTHALRLELNELGAACRAYTPGELVLQAS